MQFSVLAELLMSLNTSHSDNGLNWSIQVPENDSALLREIYIVCSRSVDTKNGCVADYEIAGNLDDSPSSLTWIVLTLADVHLFLR